MDRLLLCSLVLLFAACGGEDPPSPAPADVPVLPDVAPADVSSDGETPLDLAPDAGVEDGGPDGVDSSSDAPLPDAVGPDTGGSDADSVESGDADAELSEDALSDTDAASDVGPDDAAPVDVAVDTAIEDTSSDASEDVQEDTAQDALPDGLEDAVTDGVGDAVTDGVGDAVTDGVGDAVTDGVDDAVEDSPPVDPCLGANCDDGDPCTQNGCVDGVCVFGIVDEDDGASCGPSHACEQGQCVPSCAALVKYGADLTTSPGGLDSDNCAWTEGSGWICSGAGDAGLLTSPELEDLGVFRVDLTAELSAGSELAVTWPLEPASQWRTVRLGLSELSITTGAGALSDDTLSVGPVPLSLDEGDQTLTIVRLADRSVRVLVGGITVVKTGVLAAAPERLDLTLAPAFLTVKLTDLELASLISDCDDENPCTADGCDWVSGLCVAEDLDGAACPDDGLDCTTESCLGGACDHVIEPDACLIDGLCYASGAANPEDPCAVCSPAMLQEGFSPSDPLTPTVCDDGDPCTESDLCQGWSCLGTPKDCDDGSSCTLDLCDGGLCEHLSGEDGLWCGEASLCAEGACELACLGPPELETSFADGAQEWTELAGSWVAEEESYIQSGGGAGGVTHPALTGLKSFELLATLRITEDDPVVGTQGVARFDLYDGELSPGELPRYRVQLQTNHPVFGGSLTLSFSGPGFLVQVDQALIDLAVGQPVSLGVRWTPDARLEVTIDGELLVDLTDFGGGPESLTAALGFDQHGAIDDLLLVSSGQFCDDGLSCTDDLCLEDGSCEAELIADACLLDGVCYGSGDLSSENPCALCDPSVTGLEWSPSGDPLSPVLCTPEDPCEEGGACAEDSLQCLGEPVVCDDEDPCTEDACVEGACTFVPVTCDDEDPCTTDACDQGVCVASPVTCDDEDPCTADSCVEGICQFDPIEGCGEEDASDGADSSDASDGSSESGEDDAGPSPP